MTTSTPRRFRWRLSLLLIALAALALTLAPASASARTTRPYESSFGAFSEGPLSLAVDQSNGDIYVFDQQGAVGTVSRFTAAGVPDVFTAGPGAGTNTLSGFSEFGEIAIDNSGGPLDGTVYIGDGAASSTSDSTFSVNAYARDGSLRGAIHGTTTPAGEFNSGCGLAVDQADGALYVSTRNASASDMTWRYLPSTPTGAIDDADYELTGIIGGGCGLAADSGNVYIASAHVPGLEENNPGVLSRYSAADFAPNAPQVSGTTIDTDVVSIAVDAKTGDLYADYGNRVQVFDPNGILLYHFGAGAYFGRKSTGIAIKSGASGPAAQIYVADRASSHQVDVFGAPVKANTFTHAEIASFGEDGTSDTTFGEIARLAFDQATRRLFVVDESRESNGIYGFDASAPPAFPPLVGFTPLSLPGANLGRGLAVDNTSLASAGRIYLASLSTDLLYGFDPAGAPLGGVFPLDPAISPGPPDGSPKDLPGTAVDSAGNIWLANAATKRILKYTSAGAPLPGSIDTSAQGSPGQLTFDTNDDLYLTILGYGAAAGVWRYTAASGYTAATHIMAAVENGNGGEDVSLALDPSTHHLYVATGFWVDEYDPDANLIDEFAIGTPRGELGSGTAYWGVAVDPSNHYVYLAERYSAHGESFEKIHVYGPGLLLPDARTALATDFANTTATLNGKVTAQSLALSDCHFEYVTEAAFRLTGFTDLSSGASLPCVPAAGSIPLDLEEHPVSAAVTGLSRDTRYRFRLSATNANGTTTTADVGFATAAPPLVETTGSPLRTATTAQLEGRVDPTRAAASYHFEYGDQGPCDANPCTSTPSRPAGSGDLIELASEPIEGLQPATTYHYRLIADNGNSDGPATGADMTVTTQAPEVPLSHGHFPGPPGSDRAYEQVSLPDSGGNPVGTPSFSDNGERSVYSVLGGTPLSETGSGSGIYDADRLETSPHKGFWQTRLITPPRDQLVGPDWLSRSGGSDLSSFAVSNGDAGGSHLALWRLTPDGSPLKLFQPVPPQQIPDFSGGYFSASDDGSRVIARLQGGTLDPAYPAAAGVGNLYDISSGSTPQLVSFLPGQALATCGTAPASTGDPYGAPLEQTEWLSADGSSLTFASQGAGPCGEASAAQLYIRDLDAATTRLVSGPVLSGPDCGAILLRAIPGADFFWTQSRLSSVDTSPDSCNRHELADARAGDVYRYDVGDQSLKCLTCVVPGLDADIPNSDSAVSEDGSRLYFNSPKSLLPGAPSDGTYRLRISEGDLAYVGPLKNSSLHLTTDGSQLLFASADFRLNPLGATADNDGTPQLYRYDDRDRSLVCVSCPRDGSLPRGASTGESKIAADGTFAFATPSPLLGADQNTPAPGADPRSGTDVYEWRDGRLFLVTDGLTNWTPELPPGPVGISRSGRDIFFNAYAQYTPDALDPYNRIYDARIGGGFEFPPPPPSCPLEVCQGTPKGAPEEQSPGTSDFRGPGNPPSEKSKCPKGKVGRSAARGSQAAGRDESDRAKRDQLKKKGKCVKKHRHHKRHHKRHHRAAGPGGRSHR